MKFLAIWAAAILMGSGLKQPITFQARNVISIQGSCYNAGTGEDFQVKAFAVFGKGELLLGESNEIGTFVLQVPDSTRSLRFERQGFQAAIFPVHFSGGAEGKVPFNILVPMSSVDSQSVHLDNRLYLGFNFPDSLDVLVKVVKASNQAIVTELDSRPIRRLAPFFHLRNVAPDSYLITASTKDGRQLLREEVTTAKGFTFKELTINAPISTTSTSTPTNSSWKPNGSEILYFGQSSYDLSTEVRERLNTMARYLREQPGQKAQITGYTEDAGREELNRTLSEYRARTVMNYLKSLGVPARQLSLSWMGANSPAAPNDTEQNRIKNRRVVVQFSQE
ncbi:OmpA family protein [Telluribacter sp.]|jgi:outer membrane protein OmpA-like peptidoglycan-associated protein|uniref:OmpA family protein n=1 Tax=Telluribacter sp. TaxID=1978767 RepID=UPI002E12C34F|nr:OmpA family protein [Telluribacter sp.]